MIDLVDVLLDNLRMELRNQFEGLELDGDASPGDEWQELKDTAAETSQTHLVISCRCRRDWVIGATLALAGKARLVKRPHEPNHRDLRKQTARALRSDRNTY